MNGSSGANHSIIEEHFEEVAFLWNQWSKAMLSSEFCLRDIRAIEERIDAHASALQEYRTAGASYVEARLGSAADGDARVAAWWLLRYRATGGSELVFRAFVDSDAPGRKRAIVDAIVQAGHGSLAAQVMDLSAGDDVELLLLQMRLAATETTLGSSRLPFARLLRSQVAMQRIRAWECASCCLGAVGPEQTLAGALDEDAAVRRASLFAAAWGGQTWVLEHCRRAAAKPSASHAAELEQLSIVGEATDAELILGLVGRTELGPDRFALLGALGRVAAIPALLQAMQVSDCLTASVAGAVFTRITGRTLHVVGRVPVLPKEGATPDEFEMEFLEELPLFDSKEAAAHWQETHGRYDPELRYSHGQAVPAQPPFSQELDIVSIREACLRAAFAGKPGPKAVDFERFPLRL